MVPSNKNLYGYLSNPEENHFSLKLTDGNEIDSHIKLLKKQKQQCYF